MNGKIELETKTHTRPQFKGKIEAACWLKKTKDGEQYLTVKIGGMIFNLFKNKPYEKK